MDKAKRKGQALNLRRYWLFFGILAFFLLIPFRLINQWALTMMFYSAIIVVTTIVLVMFINRHGWRLMLVPLLIICIMMSSFHIYTHRAYYQYPCAAYPERDGLLQPVLCTEGCGAQQHMLQLGDSSIGIQTFFGRYIPYCLY